MPKWLRTYLSPSSCCLASLAYAPQWYASLLTIGDGSKTKIYTIRVKTGVFLVAHTKLSKMSNYKNKVVAYYNAFDTTCDLLLYYLQITLAGAESTIASFCACYGHLGNLFFFKER